MENQCIYIVDDNDSFRQSTNWLLTGWGYNVADYGNPLDALKALDSDKECSCVLLDVRMPSMSGLDFHEQLIASDIHVPVVYMTGHGDVALAVEAMKKGAITFLEKPLNSASLVNALSRANEIFLQAKKREKTDEKVVEFRARLQKLTPREHEVMNFIVDGKANKVIAFDLGISQKTVELHRSRVMRKLPIRSSQELVKMVMLSQ